LYKNLGLWRLIDSIFRVFINFSDFHPRLDFLPKNEFWSFLMIFGHDMVNDHFGKFCYSVVPKSHNPLLGSGLLVLCQNIAQRLFLRFIFMFLDT